MNLEESIARLEEACRELQLSMIPLRESQIRLARSTALMKLSKQDNPYYPLVRVMCKLKLIKGWCI